MNGSVSLLNQFVRTLARPLEANSVFNSYDEALKYCKENKTAYPGQVISVVTGTGVTLYVLDNKCLPNKVGSYYASFPATNSPQIILHGLGRCPTIIFVGNDNKLYEVDVEYTDLEKVKVEWNDSSIQGTIYVI